MKGVAYWIINIPKMKKQKFQIKETKKLAQIRNWPKIKNNI